MLLLFRKQKGTYGLSHTMAPFTFYHIFFRYIVSTFEHIMYIA